MFYSSFLLAKWFKSVLSFEHITQINWKFILNIVSWIALVREMFISDKISAKLQWPWIYKMFFSAPVANSHRMASTSLQINWSSRFCWLDRMKIDSLSQPLAELQCLCSIICCRWLPPPLLDRYFQRHSTFLQPEHFLQITLVCEKTTQQNDKLNSWSAL